MRLFIVLLALALPAAAQDKPAPKKKAMAAKAHKKATPEQIRRFNELEKKRQREATR